MKNGHADWVGAHFCWPPHQGLLSRVSMRCAALFTRASATLLSVCELSHEFFK